MDNIMYIFIFIFIISLVAIVVSSKNAKNGKLIPLKFRHIQGISNLIDGELVIISSDEKSINIGNKFYIPKDKINNKTVTNAKMLTDKQKSVIQRGLAGLVVAGPLGAIVGGISGVGAKKGIEKVNFLTIDYVDGSDVEQSALFSLEDVSHLMYLNMFAKSQVKG